MQLQCKLQCKLHRAVRPVGVVRRAGGTLNGLPRSGGGGRPDEPGAGSLEHVEDGPEVPDVLVDRDLVRALLPAPALHVAVVKPACMRKQPQSQHLACDWGEARREAALTVDVDHVEGLRAVASQPPL